MSLSCILRCFIRQSKHNVCYEVFFWSFDIQTIYLFVLTVSRLVTIWNDTSLHGYTIHNRSLDIR